ncbi:MAG: BatD family protein [Chitinophagales bacterium]
MKRIKDMWRCNILFLLVIGACCHGFAQNVVFTAVAGANKIGVKDQVQVQYTVRDAQNLQSISNPASPDFTIVGGPYQSQSSNTSIIGNKVTQSQSISLTYVIQPKHEGTFTIPPVVAKDAAGHSYQSNALTIQVIPGSVMQQQRRQAQAYDQMMIHLLQSGVCSRHSNSQCNKAARHKPGSLSKNRTNHL